jgi:DNA-binding CsgD family transcriptional regulator
VILGRDDERRRLDRVRAGGVLVVRGPAGVGKSALVGTVSDGALTTSGVRSEVELAFSGLHRLLTPLADRFVELPAPQSHALSCALGMAGGEATDLLVCAAVLGLLRKAAPVTLVVDDAHDVDRATMLALLFAARRLSAEDAVGMIVVVRDPAARSVDTAGLPELRLTGLPAPAVARLLDTDAATAVALTAITGGNPLVLKEIAGSSALLRQTLVTGRAPVGELFTARLSTLPAHTRDPLAVAAAEDTGDLATIDAACARLGVPAVTELPGLVSIVGGELRFSHPLVRAAAYAVPAARRRRVHGIIADTLPDGPRARRHRALSTVGPDDDLAADLERDADLMSRRGGIAAAVTTLLESARLSGDEVERRRRRAAAAHAAWKSGQPGMARELVPEGMPARLRGMVELYGGDQVTAYEFLARGTEPDLLVMGVDAAIHGGRVDEAAALGRRIGEFPGYEQYGQWLVEMISDVPPDATPWQILDAAPPAVRDSGAHRWLLPMAMSLRGRHLEQTREFALTACEDLRVRGTLAIYPIMLTWLAEVELRIGLWDEAHAHAEEGLHAARDIGHRGRTADVESLLALIAAARGDEDACTHHARLALACPLRNELATAQATWAMGLMRLSLGDHRRAAEHLTDLRHDHVRRTAMADTVEALVRLGDIEEASRVTVTAGQSIDEGAAPWLHAILHRCQALLSGEEKEFRQALDGGLPFDRARTALSYGQWLRRERRIKEARAVLRLGHEEFDRLGARPWASRAATELRACGGTTAPEGELTHQEHEIASLAATGLSNREIGQRLYLSHRTVGYHLHKVFRKLGVVNRTQLRDRTGANTRP